MIELIISVAITGIIASIIFGSFNQQNRRSVVRQAALQVAIDLQRMYTDAQAGKKNSGSPVSGYGVTIDIGSSLTSYRTFVDTDGNGLWSGAGETLATRQLPTDTRFASPNGLLDGGTPTTRLDNLYQIPGAALAVKIAGGANASGGAIIIKLENSKITSLVECVKIIPKIGAVSRVVCP